MSSKELGTLIVVILKARNLPNKRHIGKQDPYCSVRLNSETRRTKAVKRGGQHPEWDEEVRFTIFEAEQPPPPPPKKDGEPEVVTEKEKEKEKPKKKIKGGTKMQLMCYADDPKEPDLIGETMVDLTEVLTKGETDEWFTLMNKEKYCGEVFLELTFWSNEKPPKKRPAPQPSTLHPQYGGPGSFTPSTTELPASLRLGNSRGSTSPSPSRVPSATVDPAVPPSLRPSGSLASISLYQAPYERQGRYSDVDQLSNSVSDMSIGSSRRRESAPHNQNFVSEFGYAGGSPRHNSDSYPTVSSGSLSSIHSLQSSTSRIPHTHHRNSLSSLPEGSVHESHTRTNSFSQYDGGYGQAPVDHYAVDGSSGFPVPLPTGSVVPIHGPHPPISQGYGYNEAPPPLQESLYTDNGYNASFSPYPSNDISRSSRTPVPYHYNPPQPMTSSGFVPPQSAPSTIGYRPTQSPPQPTSSAMSFHHSQAPQQQYPPAPSQTPFPYPSYSASPAPYSAVDQSLPPPQHYSPHQTPSPPHSQQPQASNAYQQPQPSGPPPSGSRPLPTPQLRPDQFTPSGFVTPAPSTPAPPGPAFPTLMPFQPPGPPPSHSRRGNSLPPTPTKTPTVSYPPPPPPSLQNGMQSHTGIPFPPPPLQNGMQSHIPFPPPPPPTGSVLHHSHESTSPQPHNYGSQSPPALHTPAQPHMYGSPSHQSHNYISSQQSQPPPPPPVQQPAQSHAQWIPPPPPPPPPLHDASGFPQHTHMSQSSHYSPQPPPPPPPLQGQPQIYQSTPPRPPPTTAQWTNSPQQHGWQQQ